jgi:hypothetical protein
LPSLFRYPSPRRLRQAPPPLAALGGTLRAVSCGYGPAWPWRGICTARPALEGYLHGPSGPGGVSARPARPWRGICTARPALEGYLHGPPGPCSYSPGRPTKVSVPRCQAVTAVKTRVSGEDTARISAFGEVVGTGRDLYRCLLAADRSSPLTPIVRNVVNTAQGVLVLCSNGLPYDALTLARRVYEDQVLARVLCFNRDLDSAFVDHGRALRVRPSTIQALGWLISGRGSRVAPVVDARTPVHTVLHLGIARRPVCLHSASSAGLGSPSRRLTVAAWRSVPRG